MTCRAIRQQDQMACGACGLQWDADDASPPPCGLAAPIPDDRDQDALLVTGAGPKLFSTPGYDAIDDDFDPDDLPHSLEAYL